MRGADRQHAAQVERVARRGLERPDAALAKHHARFPARHHVLGGAEPLVRGRPCAALEEDWPPGLSHRAEQIEVLHVAGADLQDVGLLGDRLHLIDRHHLGDDGKPDVAPGSDEPVERLVAVPLEGVGVRAWLEDTAADRGGPAGSDFACDAQYLLGRFDRARPGDHGAISAAHLEWADFDDRRRTPRGRMGERLHRRRGALLGRDARRLRRGLSERDDLHVARGSERHEAGRVCAEDPHAHRILRRTREREERRSGEDVELRRRRHRAGAQESERHLRAGVIRHPQVDEDGVVLILVGQVLDEDVEPGPLGGAAGADGRIGRGVGGDEPRGARGVEAHDRLDAQRPEPLQYLTQGGGMRPGALHVAERRALFRRER